MHGAGTALSQPFFESSPPKLPKLGSYGTSFAITAVYMRIFHCDHCRQAIFFENTYCEKCGHKLAYLPDLQIVASLDPADGRSSEVGGKPPQFWTSPVPRAQGKTYRLCENYEKHNVCNWALPADSPSGLCPSCRLTRVIPDLSQGIRRNGAGWKSPSGGWLTA